MLSAKTEVSTNSDMIRSTKSVPTIETPPISSGIEAATTPRKTSRRSSARIGKAISSALVRSVLVWSLTSLKLGRVAAHRDVEPARGDQRLDVFGDDPALVFEVAVGEVDEEDQRAAVGGDQLGAGAAVVQRVDDAADVVDPAICAAEPATSRRRAGLLEVERPAAGARTTRTIAGFGS